MLKGMPKSLFFAVFLTISGSLFVSTSAPGAALAPPAKQVLKVGIGTPSEGRVLDPAKGTYSDTASVQRAVFAPLYEPSKTAILVPFVASGQPTISADGLHITVKLRANARWSDGRSVVAKDVVMAFARSRAKQNYYASLAGAVSKVVAVNTKTVRIDLTTADPSVLALLATNAFTPVPSHVIAKRKEAWTSPKYVVASGPFKVLTSSRRLLVLTRNALWWGARSTRLQRLEFHTTGGNIPSFNALKLRKVDLVFPRVLSAPGKATKYGVVLRDHLSQETQYAYLNTRNTYLQDVRVRRGIALAIDRATIVKNTTEKPATSVLPIANAGAAAAAGNRLLGAAGTPDVAAAQALLTAGGWNPAQHLRMTYTGTARGQSVALAIQTSLAAAGVVVDLVPVSGDVMATQGYGISPTRTDIDIAFQGWVADHGDPWNYYQLFTCANIDAGLNTANYCDATYDAIAAGIATTFSWSARLDAFQQLEDRLTGPDGTFPVVPLYSPNHQSIAHPWVRSYTINGFGVTAWEKVAVERH